MIDIGLRMNLGEGLSCLPLELLCFMRVELTHELLQAVLEISHLAFEGQANALTLHCLSVATLRNTLKLLVR